MRIFAMVSLVILALSGFGRADAQVLRIATGNYEPHVGENLAGGGPVNRHVADIIEAAGLEAEFHYMPWKRALEATRSGRFFASCFWSFTEERQEDFIHVGPVQMDPIVLWVRNDSPVREWNALSDLVGLRIGVVPGYTYTPEMWEMGAAGTLTLTEAPSDETNLKKLLAGRIDVFPTSKRTGTLMVQTLFSPEERAILRVLEKPLDTNFGFLLVSRNVTDSESLAARLQAVVDNRAIPLTN